MATQMNGTRLDHIERGRGDPVVLVHGTLGDLRSWEFQMGPFAERYRTISYSRRYHHPNGCDGHGSEYSAALHADDLAALITGLGLDSAHIVGNSYGAYTALFLAARHPQRVRTLVLAEPPLLPLLEHHPEGRALRDDFLATVWGPAGDHLRRGRVEEGISVFVDALFGEGAYAQVPPEVRHLVMDNACAFAMETASPGFWTPFSCEAAGRVDAPTLLLHGGKSLRLFELVVEELARCLPDNEHVAIPDSTHDLPASNAPAYNAIVLDFLAKHST